MPLSMFKPGDTSCIKRITGQDETRRHLANLGFVVGEQVTVVSKLAGNLIINVKGTRVAIDQTMANRIMV